MRAVVYRAYSAAGKLLYVGATAQPGGRLTMHSQTAEWWVEATRIELEHFATKQEALSAERTAILQEDPAYNKCWWSQAQDKRNGVSKTLFGEALANSGVTSRELAAHLGVNESQVSRWRNGKHRPIPGQQVRIADILGASRLDLWPVAELAEHKERA